MVGETKDEEVLRTFNDGNYRVYPKGAVRSSFIEQGN